jgi:hypothetical protein
MLIGEHEDKVHVHHIKQDTTILSKLAKAEMRAGESLSKDDHVFSDFDWISTEGTHYFFDNDDGSMILCTRITYVDSIVCMGKF